MIALCPYYTALRGTRQGQTGIYLGFSKKLLCPVNVRFRKVTRVASLSAKWSTLNHLNAALMIFLYFTYNLHAAKGDQGGKMTGFQLLLQDLLHRHGVDTTEHGLAMELQTLLCKSGYDFPYELVEAHVIGTDRCPDQDLALALIDVFGLDEAGIHEFSRMIVFGQRPVGQLSDALRSSDRGGKVRARSQPPRQDASSHRA